MSTIKERIQRIMTESGLTQQDFARRLGVSPASISSIFSGRTNPTLNHVEAIRRAFPQINTEWLMFGAGTMYRSGDEQPSAEVLPSPTGEDGQQPSLFSSSELQAEPMDQHGGEDGAAGRELIGEKRGYEAPVSASERAHTSPYTMGINIDNRGRKIQEIRVFYSDGTYEAFVPAKR